ncbi:MAG: FeoA domain-containing protein [Sphingobacteriales bacterium]|nr:FeoA domain-containing protein [Sphingobacteriales bacterium]
MISTSILVRYAHHLAVGESSRICALQQNNMSLVLMQRGCVPGAPICMVRRSLRGHTLYIKVGSQALALRAEEAALIVIE